MSQKHEHEVPVEIQQACDLLHKYVCDNAEKGKENHKCCGTLIIHPGGIEAQCPKCGNCFWEERDDT